MNGRPVMLAGAVPPAPRTAPPARRPLRDAATIRAQRMRAGSLFAQGMCQAQVVAALGEASATVSRWHATWRRHGIEGLARKPRTGPRGKLSASQLAAVDAALAAGPQANGFAEPTWTIARAAVLIEQVTGVQCSLATTQKILSGRLGWTRQSTWVKTGTQAPAAPDGPAGAST